MMLTGRSPFIARTKQALIELLKSKEPDFPEGIDLAWRALLQGMLTKDPALRISLSAIIRNSMFDEVRTQKPPSLDLSTSRHGGLNGTIIVTDEDVRSAICERNEVDMVLCCDDGEQIPLTSSPSTTAAAAASSSPGAALSGVFTPGEVELELPVLPRTGWDGPLPPDGFHAVAHATINVHIAQEKLFRALHRTSLLVSALPDA
jgi:serine/threonine protein kinase